MWYELSGASLPDPPHQGLCPWTPLGTYVFQAPLPPNPGYTTAIHEYKPLPTVNKLPQ